MATEPAARDRILAEAASLFVARGYHGISMREIAEQVGLSKAALYYHFEDKESLFLAVLQENLESLERLIAESHAQPTTRARLGWLLRAIFAQAPAQRAIIRLANQEIRHLDPAARAEFARLYEEKFTGQIAALLQNGIDRGELRVLDVKQATWVLLGMMYPFFYPSGDRGVGDGDEAIALMLDIFFEGAKA